MAFRISNRWQNTSRWWAKETCCFIVVRTRKKEASELRYKVWCVEHCCDRLTVIQTTSEELSHELSVLPVNYNHATEQGHLAGLSNVPLFGLPTHLQQAHRDPFQLSRIPLCQLLSVRLASTRVVLNESPNKGVNQCWLFINHPVGAIWDALDLT